MSATQSTTTDLRSVDCYLPAATARPGEVGVVESVVKRALDTLYLESEE